jgi:mannose/fructose/N-acetylgalactosamine-specific phosphotransferase system component IIB
MLSVCRIDDRLIHGQVAMKWTLTFSITNIVIIDNGVANNQMLKNLNINMAPRGSVVQVLTEEEALPVLKQEHESSPTHTLVVAKLPGIFLSLVEAGLKIENLIVGNMGYSTGRRQLTKNLYVTAEEAGQLLKFKDLGVNLTARTMPEDHPKDITSALLKITQEKGE